jgi:DNA-binding beta-propeller fold protein YncE
MLYRLFLAALTTCAGASTQSFINYESGPVNPLRISSEGSRLYIADTLGGRLSVFDLSNPDQPFLRAEIPVGMDPVSVHPRTLNEVWVANLLSDSISIVDVSAGRVVDTLRVVDEPSDVVFAGGKAFVTAATRDEVHVFDAITRAPLTVIDIFGKDPRALAVSPDGTRVYAVVQRSGNGTTILPSDVAPPPPLPTNLTLPPAPDQGLIIRADDPAWSNHISYSLPDHDIAQIDVQSLTVTRYFDGVGTTNTAIAVHPTTGDLWVTNIEARNLVRFEPNLRGHAIDSRLTRVTTGTSPTVTPFDLNVGINYAILPNPTALASSLAEPFGVAIDAATGHIYVAAHGTDRIGILDTFGNVLSRIEVGAASGAQIDTRNKRGPRGLALHPTANRLFVLNHLADTLMVIDTQTRQILGEQPIATVDPMPRLQREGRNFLYDAKLSGNGTMSCAACHIDGDTDGLSWDLGDPGGVLEQPPSQPFPFNLGLAQFHPMKGPMATQTLRGLEGVGLLHWRGDRTDFKSFNGAFDSLLGGSQIAPIDMDHFTLSTLAIHVGPNPNQLLDRSLRTTPPGNNEADGASAMGAFVNLSGFGNVSCRSCHDFPTGTNGLVVNSTVLQSTQQLKVAQLRNMYRKVGFQNAPGPQKSGFGFTHDGAVDSLNNFLALPVFNPWPQSDMDDIVTFLLSADTGTAPAVGYQFVMDQANATTAQVAADMQLLTNQAAPGDLDLTAHGYLDGELTGLLYQPLSNQFVTDRAGVGPFTPTQLQSKAQGGQADLAFTAVTLGTGERIALDRNTDGILNGAAAPANYGIATPGCSGPPKLVGNSEPFIGNGQFGYALENAQANSFGILAMALGQASIPVLGVQLMIDPTTAVPIAMASDDLGNTNHAFPIPADAALVGVTIHTQALWLDWCGAELWASSDGVSATIQP